MGVHALKCGQIFAKCRGVSSLIRKTLKKRDTCFTLENASNIIHMFFVFFPFYITSKNEHDSDFNVKPKSVDIKSIELFVQLNDSCIIGASNINTTRALSEVCSICSYVPQEVTLPAADCECIAASGCGAYAQRSHQCCDAG